MWNLLEPQLLRMEPVCCMRNLAEPGARFRAAAPNHPEALLEEPQAFQAVGEKCKMKIYETMFLRVFLQGQIPFHDCD